MENPVRVRGPRGFTLIELLVAMALLLVLLTLSMPSLMAMLHQAKIRGVVQETAVLMRLARIRAIKRSVQSVVRIVPSTGPGYPGQVQAFLDLDSDNKLGANDTMIGALELPSGVVFEECPSKKTDKDSVSGLTQDPDGGPNILIFKSDGSRADNTPPTTDDDGGAFRFNDPFDNCMEVYVGRAATARIEARKWNGTKYITNGENGEAWTWN